MPFQVVPNEYGNVMGRIGKGFGQSLAQGLSEQVPKEAERIRLSQGLRELSSKKNLSPEEYLAEVASVPGALSHPQLIQSFGELAKQRRKSEGMVKEAERNPVTTQAGNKNQSIKEGSSITTPEAVQATLHPELPLTPEDKLAMANDLYQNNREAFQTFQDAQNFVDSQEQQKIARNAAIQQQRQNEQGVQSRLEQEFEKNIDNLGVELPGTVKRDIFQKASDNVKSGKMTEKEAADLAGKELDTVSRDYKALETLGHAKILTQTPSANQKTIRSIREGFKKRGDLENFSDELIANQKLSPSKAAYLAYPVSEHKELNNAIVSLPALKKTASMLEKGHLNEEQRQKKNMSAYEKLAPIMKKTDASPLAIAEELNAKGYDPEGWLDYVESQREKLNLSERQGRELGKPRNFVPTFDDIWMFTWSGLDPLVEIE
jgi:hypothetical protein